MNFTTRKDMVELSRDNPYWKSWPIRWEYMAVTMAWLQGIHPLPCSILEAGTNGISTCTDSVSIGLDSDTHTPSIVHDITQAPWPIKDKEFDVFIALQVWEHLDGGQQRAFQEAQRISKHIILSFPYLWLNPDKNNCHYNITADTIDKWTFGIQPTKKFITNDETRCNRIVYHWDMT